MNSRNPNDFLASIQGIVLDTSDGEYIRMADLRRLMAEQVIEQLEQPEPQQFKTWESARAAAKKFLIEQNGPQTPQLGKAVPAFEPQPPSRA